MTRQAYYRQVLIVPGTLVALMFLTVFRTVTQADDPSLSEPPPSEAQKKHWAYQPIQRPTPPELKQAGGARNPIDQFIQQGLEELALSPSPQADRISLIRRATYDLTGLPPTPEAVDSFVADTRVDAYERLIDRLLASPAYGERWAQHWLDLAHYADSNGFELDADRPDAWRFRDWVVESLNQDLPYTDFVRLQLAGDELHPGNAQALIATGFGRCGPREVVSGNIDPEVRRQSELTEVTGTVGSVFLGLTLACARCHDHKFDAISAKDYFRFQAVFAAAQFADHPIATEEERAAYDSAKKAADARLAPLRARQAELEAPFRNALRAQKEQGLSEAEKALLAIPAAERTPLQTKQIAGAEKALNVTWDEVAEAVAHDSTVHAEREKIKREIFEVEQTLPAPPASAMALLTDEGEPPLTFVLNRGDTRSKGEKVKPGSLRVLTAPGESATFEDSVPSDRRIRLAAWITSTQNPLPARVIVNRLWQYHFGKGIVATSSDFGVRGESPTHPELLDWLAAELIDKGWNLKPLHRLMMTSATYRQSSTAVSSELRTADPENQLLGRMNRRRLDAEGVRDSLLAASGNLFLKQGGQGVRPRIEKEIEALIFTEAEVVDLWPENPDRREHNRRALYLFRKRNVRYPLFDAFDAPDTQSACPRRETSTHAIQPLILLNSEFGIDQAKGLAGRVLREAHAPSARLETLYRVVLSRLPRPEELALAQQFLDSESELITQRLDSGNADSVARPDFAPADLTPAQLGAWVDLAMAMLNRTEFLYVP